MSGGHILARRALCDSSVLSRARDGMYEFSLGLSVAAEVKVKRTRRA